MGCWKPTKTRDRILHQLLVLVEHVGHTRWQLAHVCTLELHIFSHSPTCFCSTGAVLKAPSGRNQSSPQSSQPAQQGQLDTTLACNLKNFQVLHTCTRSRQSFGLHSTRPKLKGPPNNLHDVSQCLACCTTHCATSAGGLRSKSCPKAFGSLFAYLAAV